MKTIVWDIDDVLNDLMKMWFEEKWLITHPECTLRYSDITQNPPSKLLGTTLDDYLASLDEYRSSIYENLSPVSDVIYWFNSHGFKYRHMALTSCPFFAAPISAKWVFAHYGNWIRTFHCVPSKRHGESVIEYDKTKAEFLYWLKKADIYIDDNAENISEAEKKGITCLLWPRPWNNSKFEISDVLRILSYA